MISQFIGNIFGPVEPGQIFIIAGKTLDGASRLDINFKSGKNENASIILHMSCRFYEDVIVRNSWTPNGWDVEETERNLNEFTTPNPVVAGDNFKIYILVGDTYFHIAINDQPFCIFYYRMSNQLIRTIEVTKDVQSVTQIDHRSAFPSPCPIVQQDAGYIAFSNDIPRRFKPGHIIVITGIPSGNSRGTFILYFTERAKKQQTLHFNPRFEPTFVVVRNAMNESLNFGIDERHGSFPFALDEQFTLAIGITDSGFKFAINGVFFGRFGYRSENPLPIMNGFKISTGNGMHLAITKVDHVATDSNDCDGIEGLSHPDNYIE